MSKLRWATTGRSGPWLFLSARGQGCIRARALCFLGQRARTKGSMSNTHHPLRALGRYWRLLAHYLRPQWPRMALLVLTLCTTIGVQVATPLLASRFIDRATAGGALRTLITLAVLTMALALLGQGVAVIEAYVAENVSWTATNALRADLVAHLLRLDASFHSAHSSGELIERVDGDVATLARFFSRFVVYVLGSGLLVLGMIALLCRVDWRIGLGLGSFAALALVAMLRIRAAATPS